ncbi:MAG: vitamin B12-dependent ribonucleotide reductase [Chloroflexi bacterium]|nr:vitamin B12-dependent ribonucleotide reductase [Chloroflexota bacterium]
MVTAIGVKWPRPALAGNWTEAARKVLAERYLLRDERGQVCETPEDALWRVACAIAAAEAHHGGDEATVRSWAERFYTLMVTGRFLPNSPTLMNAGKNNGLQYSACYVLPVEDSLEGIFESIKRAAIIHKSGGGTGFSFSRLRSKDARVSTTGGKASGPVSFLRVFDAATEAVKQGGTRRGANMGILRVDHPDILEFITCKLDGGITNFNISVGITDAFMAALEADEEYPLIAPESGNEVGRLRARDVFAALVDAAWRSGDPGVVFLDRINASPANPTPALGLIEATNPCGEQPLFPNEACNLGSINLAAFIRPPADPRQPWAEPPASRIAWEDLDQVVADCVRFLDDVIDVNPYPLPEIVAAVRANRRIGLGVMGWADALIELGVLYDSEEALALAEQVMQRIRAAGYRATEALAVERGPFPNWQHSIYASGVPRRNSTVTTIAPTGTISIIAGCSSGIEPLFALAYRHRAPGQDRLLTFVNPVAERVLALHGLASPTIAEAIAEHGTLEGVAGVPERIRRVLRTAHEIAPEWHVRMQAAWQRWTDNAVSKTINLRNEATREDVAIAYRLAYEAGCLGITVFRDGCKGEAAQVLHVGSSERRASEEKPAPPAEPGKLAAGSSGVRPRPSVVHGYTRQIVAPEGKVNVTLNSDEQGLLEVFINVGKAGSDIAALAEALGRLVSLNLRMAGPLSPNERAREIANQLRGIGGSRSVGFGPNQVRSLPDAVARALELHLGEERPLALDGGPDLVHRYPSPVLSRPSPAVNGAVNGGSHPEPAPLQTVLAVATKTTGNLCPECGCNTLFMMEGCKKCEACGYSEC